MSRISLAIGAALLVALSQQHVSASTVAGAQGRELYERWCATCHARGSRMPGTLALAVRYGDRRSPVLHDEPVDRRLVTLVVRRGMGAMPRFRKTEISDSELALIADYLAQASGR